MLRNLVILLFISSQATAGPWPRGEKKGFVSYTVSSFQNHDGTDHLDYNTLYAEYGLNPDYTIGLDVGISGDGLEKLHGFLRFPPLNNVYGWSWSSDIGFGISEKQRPTFRTNIITGRSFNRPGFSGWITYELRSYIVSKIHKSWIEGEATIGENLNGRLKAILQWQDQYDSKDKYVARLAPSLVWEFLPGHHLESGISIGTIHSDGIRLRLGFWHQF